MFVLVSCYLNIIDNCSLVDFIFLSDINSLFDFDNQTAQIMVL